MQKVHKGDKRVLVLTTNMRKRCIGQRDVVDRGIYVVFFLHLVAPYMATGTRGVRATVLLEHVTPQNWSGSTS